MSDLDFALQHVHNMRVAQSRIHAGDARYYVETANGYVVHGPFSQRQQAQQKLDDLRARVEEEIVDESA